VEGSLTKARRRALAKSRHSPFWGGLAVVLTQAALFLVSGFTGPMALAGRVVAALLAFWGVKELQWRWHHYHTVPLEFYRQEASRLKGELRSARDQLALQAETVTAPLVSVTGHGGAEFAASSEWVVAVTITNLGPTETFRASAVSHVFDGYEYQEREGESVEIHRHCVSAIPGPRPLLWADDDGDKRLARDESAVLALGIVDTRDALRLLLVGSGDNFATGWNPEDTRSGIAEVCIRLHALDSDRYEDVWIRLTYRIEGASALSLSCSVIPVPDFGENEV
jgi:hypothetical protein